MALNDAIARWCPTLDPNYGTNILTDLIGGVGNFTLPHTNRWQTDNGFKHLWFNGWQTHRANGPVQSKSQNFAFSYWTLPTSGIAWSMLSRNSVNWTGWYGNRTVLNNNFDGSFASLPPPDVPAFSGWRQIVLRQLADTHIILSVNGLHYNASTAISNIQTGTAIQIGLGASVRLNGTADNFYIGLIDDVIFWDEYLTNDEVETLYQIGRAGNLPSVVTSRRRRITRGGYGL